MSYALNLVTAPDSYDSTGQVGVIQGVAIRRLVFDVSNQAIYWNLAKGPGTGIWESTENYMAPGSRSIFEDGIVGVRVRAAIPEAQLPSGANQAVVTVRAVT